MCSPPLMVCVCFVELTVTSAVMTVMSAVMSAVISPAAPAPAAPVWRTNADANANTSAPATWLAVTYIQINPCLSFNKMPQAFFGNIPSSKNAVRTGVTPLEKGNRGHFVEIVPVHTIGITPFINVDRFKIDWRICSASATTHLVECPLGITATT